MAVATMCHGSLPTRRFILFRFAVTSFPCPQMVCEVGFMANRSARAHTDSHSWWRGMNAP